LPESRAERGIRILIDGRSGSGKTELATLLVAGWPEAQLVRLDDIYPGWDGLDAGSAHVAESVLGERPRWRRWDWAAGTPAEWHDLDPGRPLVVEGCGALSRANRRRADVGVWVELDDARRKARALTRDGAAYEPHWERWAAQEDAFLQREDPRALADVIADGSSPEQLRDAAESLVRSVRQAR
jgi:uridine kinase